MIDAQDPPERLLEEFARRHLAGELPDPVAYAERAGEEGERVLELIALFLAEEEPVTPRADAARELAGRYGAQEPVRGLLSRWLSAGAERKRELLDGLAGSVPALSLEAAGARGGEESGGDSALTLIQLNHPAGARAEVREDGLLTLAVFGLPQPFVGHRALVAFPRATPAGSAPLEWCGRSRGLPDGIAVSDEPVDEQRELRATVARIDDRRQLDPLLAEVRVVAVPHWEPDGE